MIDVGHPFSKPFQDLVDSLVESLQQGVEQPASLELTFVNNNILTYPLKGAGPVSRLAEQITGFVSGKPAIFNLDIHYAYNAYAGQLVWNPQPPEVAAGWFPDDKSFLTVGYFYRDLPSGITDFNAGSVTGTLVRAMSREFKLLYEQMDQAYRRAFIDYAQGFALDNVVALLGISRNQALPAQGKVTFFLKKAPKADVPIATGTRIADARGRLFKVTAPGVIKTVIDIIDESVTASGKIVRTSVLIGGSVQVKVKGTTTVLETVPTKAGKPFGDDESTITLKLIPSSLDLVVTYQPKIPEVTVPVIALETGPEGNLGSGSLTVMPTPPRGVDGGVTNKEPLTGGKAAETDDQLRERAKHELERAGNATLNAIRFAVLDIDGVDSVDVRDFSVDETIPLGEVWVRYSTGQSDQDVKDTVNQKVEQTRAAGIKARVTEVSAVLLSGKFYVIPDVSGNGKTVNDRYKTAVIAALKTLGIGEPVSARKLASLVFQVSGLADVAEIKLDYVRNGESKKVVTTDPLLLNAGEQARPDENNIKVISVHALAASAATLAGGGTLTVTLGATDNEGQTIQFRNLQLAVTATIRAKPLATPNQPPQQVVQASGTVTFKQEAGPTAALSITGINIPNLASLDKESIELSIQAAAYPGVLPGVCKLGT